MAIRIELAPGFAGMLPEEHDTVWIYTIDPPHLTNHRTKPGELKKILEGLSSNLTTTQGIEEALNLAKEKSSKEDLILITGSLYLVGDMLKTVSLEKVHA